MRKFLAITLVAIALALVAATPAQAQKQSTTSEVVDVGIGYYSPCSGLGMEGSGRLHFVNKSDADGYRGKYNLAVGRLFDEIGRPYVIQMMMHGTETFSMIDGVAEYWYVYHVIPVGGGKGRSVETLTIKFRIVWVDGNPVFTSDVSITCR